MAKGLLFDPVSGPVISGQFVLRVREKDWLVTSMTGNPQATKWGKMRG